MGYCLYKVGAKGPVTLQRRSALRWNDGLSFPIQSGPAASASPEDAFWDKGSFYDHSPRSKCRASPASKARPIGSV